MLTTVLDLSPKPTPEDGSEFSGLRRVREAAVSRFEASEVSDEQPASAGPPVPLDQLIQGKATAAGAAALAEEAAKGYSLAFIGLDRPITPAAHRFQSHLEHLLATFDGPVAVVFNGDAFAQATRILVPTGGAPEARLATEMALALAKATGGRLTALHVFDPLEDTELLRGRQRRGLGVSVLRDVRRLGKRSNVPVDVQTAIHSRPEFAIRRLAATANFDLIVLGASLRVGERKFLGPRTAALVQALKAPVLLIAR